LTSPAIFQKLEINYEILQKKVLPKLAKLSPKKSKIMQNVNTQQNFRTSFEQPKAKLPRDLNEGNLEKELVMNNDYIQIESHLSEFFKNHPLALCQILISLCLYFAA